MEQNKRFRNHVSIIFEQLGGKFVLLLTFLFWEFLTSAEEMWQEIKSFGTWMEDGEITISVIIVIPILLIVLFIWQFFVWSKTYISIQENVIVIEKNTLNKKINTIGIKNISNVNLEQNLFEMLLGTNKVKLDTNSLSTADSTDVKIVLKKQDAEEFRCQIMAIIYGENVSMESVEEDWKEDKKDVADISEIMLHGIFSINLLSVIIAVGTIVGMFGIIAGLAEEGFTEESVLGLISSILIIAGLGFSAIWDILQGFLRYFDFRVKRYGDKIHIQYGILKKVSYTIPVDKINAVKLIQTPQARIADRYMAEIVNVGMNDDEKNERAFFLLYGKKAQMEEKLKKLLPEFADCIEMPIVHYRPSVWCVWSLSFTFFIMCMAIVMTIGVIYFPENVKWFFGGVIIATAYVIFRRVLKYRTEGIFAGEKVLKLVNGGFGRNLVLVKYNKIQYIEAKQNFIAKHFYLQKADIALVAGTTDRIQDIPYCDETVIETVKERILKR